MTMTRAEYREYLQSPAWRSQRADALRRVRFRCQDCGEHRRPRGASSDLRQDWAGRADRPPRLVPCRHGERHGFDVPPEGMESIQPILLRVLNRITGKPSGQVA